MHLADATPAEPADAPSPPPLAEEGAAPGLRLPIHVNARGLALGVIATVAFLFALQWAEKFLVPLLLGIFAAYTLNPLVSWLERRRIPRAIGATIVTVAILASMTGVAYRVQGEFFNIVEDLPAITKKVTRAITRNAGGQPGTLAQVQAAATQIEAAAANTVPGQGAAARKAPPATASNIRVIDWVLAGSVGLAGVASQATMVVFLVFFLLLAGDTFRRKLVKLTGPSLSNKKVTVHILDDINTSIQNYMFMLLVTNIVLALLMWMALRAIGVENAGAWAIVAGLLHLMPYFGPLLATTAIAAVAFVQFESVDMALLVIAASLAIATLVGTVMSTWMTGRLAKMNPAAVFVSLLFWSWLWGVWGLLLGVPLVVVLKVVAERVEGMEVLAELLGD